MVTVLRFSSSVPFIIGGGHGRTAVSDVFKGKSNFSDFHAVVALGDIQDAIIPIDFYHLAETPGIGTFHAFCIVCSY